MGVGPEIGTGGVIGNEAPEIPKWKAIER